jgi:hypothetical protein
MGDFGLAKAGVARRDADVGRKKQFVPNGRHTALSSDDVGLRSKGRSRVERAHDIWILRRVRAGRDRGGVCRDVESPAKIGAEAMQHRDAQRVILLELVIGLAEPDQHRRIEPVTDLGPVEADQQDGATPVDVDGSGRRGLLRRKAGGGLRLRAPIAADSGSEHGDAGAGKHEIAAAKFGTPCIVTLGHRALLLNVLDRI